MGKKCALFLKNEKFRNIKVNTILFKTAKKCLILDFQFLLNKIGQGLRFFPFDKNF